MSKLNRVLRVYESCTTIDQKVQCILWAKRILKGLEVERLMFMLVKRDKGLDRVVHAYRKAL
jgi:hypothetical protein